ncbi:MAG TPA: T9SS type A sorting domain-containing protein, partial [Cytophagales bacterium]|nr:T9SS type A sorting domain-containing protein [Cytophagales bacterium]
KGIVTSGDVYKDNQLSTNGGAFFNMKFQVGNPASCGRVWVCAACTAPVKYTHFNVYATGGNEVLLTWGTAQESDNKKFVVEASTDGLHFEAIAEVAGNNNSQIAREYSFVHQLASGRQYYRIKQVDYSGTYAYTNIKSVSLYGDDVVGSVYPQPVKQGEVLHIEVNEAIASGLNLKLADASGQSVLNQNIAVAEGSGLLKLSTAGLHAGVYLLTLSNADVVKTVRIVIQ